MTKDTPFNMGLSIETDSQYTLNQVTQHLKRNEDEGYIGIANAGLVQSTVALLRKRKAPTKMKWVKGHAGHARNEGADMLAKCATHLLPPDDPKMDIDPTLKVTGAKLTKVSRSLTHKAIRAKKLAKLKDGAPRSHTAVNLKLIKDKMKALFEISPTDASFWKAIRNPDFSRQS